jgi:hypothetical protein
METVSVRLPRAILEQVDAYLADLQREAPMLMLNRTDAIRQLIAIGLKSERAQ